MREAIRREKEIKTWSRVKKIALVNTKNPKWDDLARDWETDSAADTRRAANQNLDPLAALGMTSL